MHELPDSGLSLPTSQLMSQGGDDRITIDERSGLNSYGCAPSPMTSIMYSSSTASSISSDAYRQVQAIHFRLRQRVAHETIEEIYARSLEKARNRLRSAYRLNDNVALAFGPSGTDLEYLALAISMRCGQPVCNLVVEVEEVGSGCQFSQEGRYFAPRTAQGRDVRKGDPLPGFEPGKVRALTVKLRSETGPVQAADAYGKAIEHAIQQALAAGERPLLHVIHRSKTGIIAPGLSELDQLVARFGTAFDIVVDACQGRISPDAVNAYLARGAMLFVTGSKFFGGPPFSAFALVPSNLSERMMSGEAAPAGLGDFFARADLPPQWGAVQAALPAFANFGILLRLEAALFEIERFFALPGERVDQVISDFNTAIRNLHEGLPFRLADTRTADDLAEHAPHPLDRKMLHVVELTLENPHTGRLLNFEQARLLYHLLYRDISAHFDDPEDRLIASEICHLGQPVRCLRREDGEAAPTLRFALSAPLVSALQGLDSAARVERFRTDMERVGRKLRLAAQLLDGTAERILSGQEVPPR